MCGRGATLEGSRPPAVRSGFPDTEPPMRPFVLVVLLGIVSTRSVIAVEPPWALPKFTVGNDQWTCERLSLCAAVMA